MFRTSPSVIVACEPFLPKCLTNIVLKYTSKMGELDFYSWFDIEKETDLALTNFVEYSDGTFTFHILIKDEKKSQSRVKKVNVLEGNFSFKDRVLYLKSFSSHLTKKMLKRALDSVNIINNKNFKDISYGKMRNPLFL